MSLYGAAYCATAPVSSSVNLARELNKRISVPMDDTHTIRLYFSTNRRTSNKLVSCTDRYYTVKRDEKVRYGVCLVSVPRNHTVGTLNNSEDLEYTSRNKQYIVTDHSEFTKDEFLARLKSAPGGEILLFVHGFNVKFREAVLRASQIAYDSKFQGAIVLFTWPAGAGSGYMNQFLINRTYSRNRDNARNTIGAMKELITKLSGLGKTLHVMVHSMGHQIVLPALHDIQGSDKKASGNSAQTTDGNKTEKRDGTKKERKTIIGELILNAPDYSAADFKAQASFFKKIARRITLYCSPGDKALKASKITNGGKRIGQCEKVEGVDVINVNEIDDAVLELGHGYYAQRAVLTDLFQVLLGIDASRRLFIRRGNSSGNEHFILRK